MSRAADFSAFAGQRCVVFGAGGFIGRWVARQLCAHGARVVLCVRDVARAKEVFDAWEVLGDLRAIDLEQHGEATALIQLVRPAVVFNLAGYGVDRGETDEARARRMNTELPEEIAAALGLARDLNWECQALIHVGSALEYGTARGNLQEDKTREAPTTVYGTTKLHGTQRVLQRAVERGMRAQVARAFTVYGPGEHSTRLLPSLLAAAKSEGSVPLSEGLQRRDFTYVEDVAEGLLRLALAPASVCADPQAVNLATGTLASVREFAMFAARGLGFSPDRLAFGALPTRPEEMFHTDVHIERLRHATGGWTPRTTIPQGVERTVAFLRQRGSW